MARFVRPALVSLAALLVVPGGGSASERGAVLGLDVRGATRAAVAGIPARLVRVDPLTLRVLPGRAVELQGHVSPRARSPRGGRLALARSSVPSLRLVDLRRMRSLGDVPLAPRGDVRALAWLAEERLLAVVDTTLIAVDPDRRRVLERTPLGGHVAGHGAAGQRLVLLVVPRTTLGAARLVVAGAGGRPRETVLDRIPALAPDEAGMRSVVPGLALEPSGGRAWVFAAGVAAEVDLETLAVEYRAEPRVLASRRKGPYVGSFRTALWVGDGRIALTGADRPSASEPASPTGLLLVDVDRWEARRLATGTPLTYAHAGLLLTIAGDCGGKVGLTAYEPAGTRRFHLCEPRARGDVMFAHGRAYLGRSDGRLAVAELRSGRVVARPLERGAGPLGEG